MFSININVYLLNLNKYFALLTYEVLDKKNTMKYFEKNDLFIS